MARRCKRSLLVGAALSAGISALIASPVQADTLQEALLNTYLQNPDLAAARAQLRATDASVPVEKASGLPSLSSTATYVEFVRPLATSFFAPDRVATVGVDLSVPIYQGGAVKNSVRAAEERVLAGRADLRGTESAIFSQAVAAYSDVLRTEAVVALSANQVDVLTVNLEATSDRFEIGNLTRTDVAQSRSRLALAESDLESARANLIAARENYIAIVGKAPDNLQAPPPLPGLPSDLNDAVDIALQNNPDLIAAKERADAAGYDIDVAGSGRLPTVSLFSSYDYQDTLGSIPGFTIDPEDPNSPIIDSDQTASGISAGATLTIPIFQGGRPAALQRQAQARASAALEQIIATERSVISQVRSAFASWRASLSIIELAQQAVSAASLSLEGVQAEQSIGNRQVLDVLNAEQELLSSRVQLVTARRNAYVAGFTLLAAMGRAEARDLGLDGDGVLYDPVVNYERIRNNWFDWARDADPEIQSPSTVNVPAATAEIDADDARLDRDSLTRTGEPVTN